MVDNHIIIDTLRRNIKDSIAFSDLVSWLEELSYDDWLVAFGHLTRARINFNAGADIIDQDLRGIMLAILDGILGAFDVSSANVLSGKNN